MGWRYVVPSGTIWHQVSQLTPRVVYMVFFVNNLDDFCQLGYTGNNWLLNGQRGNFLRTKMESDDILRIKSVINPKEICRTHQVILEMVKDESQPHLFHTHEFQHRVLNVYQDGFEISI